MPNNMPSSWLVKPLIPIGHSKFKGDILPAGWTANEFFTKGNTYPVYYNEGNYFVVGSDGIGKKFLAVAWTKPKFV